MSLPDSPALTAMLAAATPGEWAWKIRPRRHSLRVMIPKDGCFESYVSILETDGDYDGADYRGATEADRGMIVLAPKLAAEVIRLRAELDTLTDPSPEAQLRRYREAKALVENPPKVLVETHPSPNVVIWSSLPDRLVATVTTYPGTGLWEELRMGLVRSAETKEEAVGVVRRELTSRGWQLCGAP